LGWLEQLFDLRCPACGLYPPEPVICCQCQLELRPHHFPHLVYLGRYQRWKKVCHALKYRGQLGLARVLAAPLAQGLIQAGWPIDGVTAVPVHPWRRWQRGYNQAERLARAVAQQVALPYRSVLRRNRYTRSQTRQQQDQRSRLLADTFAPTAQVTGNWLLVDDVITSGTTLRLARQALYRAGASQVKVACIAVRHPNPSGLFVL
jgi:ComF family protein